MNWTIGVNSELCVVRIDPEYADLDHPHGEVVEVRHFLEATNNRGDRRRYGCFMTTEMAEAAIPHAPIIEVWSDTTPEYGSKAWVEYGEAEQMEAERHFNEATDAGLDTRFMIF